MGTRPYLTFGGIAVRRALAALAVLCGLMTAQPATAQAWDQGTADSQTESRASVITSGAFFRVRDLSFGDIVPGATGGTVTITGSGVRTSTGSITPVGVGFHPALFVGQGRRNQMILLSFASPTVVLTGPGAPMTVLLSPIAAIDGSLSPNRPGRFRMTATNGMFQFPVGGRLTVNPNQHHGFYSGTFTVLYEFL
jgi:hypothetical protein